MSQLLRPVGHRLLIEVIDEAADTGEPTTIIVPEAYKDLPLYGIVRGIGKRCEEFEGKVGDMVLFDKFSGNKIDKFPNILLLHEKNILGIMK